MSNLKRIIVCLVAICIRTSLASCEERLNEVLSEYIAFRGPQEGIIAEHVANQGNDLEDVNHAEDEKDEEIRVRWNKIADYMMKLLKAMKGALEKAKATKKIINDLDKACPVILELFDTRIKPERTSQFGIMGKEIDFRGMVKAVVTNEVNSLFCDPQHIFNNVILGQYGVGPVDRDVISYGQQSNM